MSILSWILFGALAGWVASLVTGKSRKQGLIMNVIVGVAGAFVGGLGVKFITGTQLLFGWDRQSFVVAVIGSVLLLLLFGRRRR